MVTIWTFISDIMALELTPRAAAPKHEYQGQYSGCHVIDDAIVVKLVSLSIICQLFRSETKLNLTCTDHGLWQFPKNGFDFWPVVSNRNRNMHDDVIKWKHFPRCWPFVREIHRSPVKSLHEGQWQRALMFSLICAWTNGWVNNRDAGDLKYRRAHYDVIVMECIKMTFHEPQIMTMSVSMLYGKNRPSYVTFKIWPSFWPGDITDDVIST